MSSKYSTLFIKPKHIGQSWPVASLSVFLSITRILGDNICIFFFNLRNVHNVIETVKLQTQCFNLTLNKVVIGNEPGDQLTNEGRPIINRKETKEIISKMYHH